ncbi:SRPBCC family protein [uncultured Corynebacterium sp.]|uniref:SRPBCC family protein n=1 Tax=uncultured Corynebacterium sp. TaxID=159447 RepID=UPI0025EE1C08|nr:SRPBCC family protein [uncultured Corynebacterium sp.]
MAAPEISASTTVNAPANAVWQRVINLTAMGDRSPQCKKMIVLNRKSSSGSGNSGSTPTPGTIYLNINRQGLLWWPTWAVVTEVVPEKVFEFKIPLNRSRWRFELETSADGTTTLTEKRLVAGGKTTLVSRALVAAFLGGEEKFEAGLAQGIQQTIRAIAMEAEES